MTDDSHLLDLVLTLRRARLRVSNESALQKSIQDVLDEMGVDYGREVRLSAADRPDFMVGSIAIEAKCRYAKKSIYRQIERYAAHDQVSAIVLVSGTAMGMPATINGKPIHFISPGLSYL
jgi:hypothetical protein